MKKARQWKRLQKKRGIDVPHARRTPAPAATAATLPKTRNGSKLVKARDYLQRGKTAKGLAVLAAHAAGAAGAASPLAKSKVVALTADSDFKKGDFAKAAELYRTAATHSRGHPRGWLRPVLAEVRALLKDAKVADAHQKANAAWDRSLAQHEEEARKTALANAGTPGQKILIGKRPHRASVVASRLGHQFWQEGEPALAAEFYRRALEINPQGASRARQGLAAIALGGNDAREAEKRAREALLLGKFQAKTISAWPILIAARQRQGLKGLDADFLAALRQHRSAPVRARAVLNIVKALRTHADPAWQQIAADWLQAEGANHPVEAVEVRKLRLATLRREGGASAAVAGELLAAPELLSLTEFAAVAKEFARTAPLVEDDLPLGGIIAQARRIFGEKSVPRVHHAIAHGCIAAKRPVHARRHFRRAIALSAPENPNWSRAVWALAQMEQTLGEQAAAAALYAQFIAQPAIPVRFRLQARIEWVRALIASGQESQIGAASADLLAVVGTIEDADLLMDLARQLYFAPGEMKNLAAQIFKRGEKLAVEAFAEELHPSRAATMLFKLARHQMDFSHLRTITKTWEELTPEQRNWLWTGKGDWWQYLALVVRAYTSWADYPMAQQTAATYLADPATPPEAVALVGVQAARAFLWQKKRAPALALYASIISNAPTYLESAYAHYWLALEAHRISSYTETDARARSVFTCIGNSPSLAWHYDLDARAHCLLARLNLEIAVATPSRHTRETLEKALTAINRDLARLNV